MDNLEEMDKFLETNSPPKLNQEEIDNLNRLITRSDIESVTKQTNKKLPANKIPGLDVFPGNYTEHTKKNLY